jgi:hypothetical protein
MTSSHLYKLVSEVEDIGSVLGDLGAKMSEYQTMALAVKEFLTKKLLDLFKLRTEGGGG